MTHLPTETDLGDFLYGAKLISTPPSGEEAAISLSTAIESAKVEWARRTGFTPFEADAADSTRYMTPQATSSHAAAVLRGDLLHDAYRQLKTGIISLTSLTVQGTALTANTDYWLEPQDAPTDGEPYTTIRFFRSPIAERRGIVAVGKFGYCAYGSVPADAFRAILKLAAMDILPEISAGRFGGGAKVKQGPVEITAAANGMGFGGELQAWEADVKRAVKRIRDKHVRVA